MDSIRSVLAGITLTGDSRIWEAKVTGKRGNGGSREARVLTQTLLFASLDHPHSAHMALGVPCS